MVEGGTTCDEGADMVRSILRRTLDVVKSVSAAVVEMMELVDVFLGNWVTMTVVVVMVVVVGVG